ncbi:hypothetical protein [Salinimicrobium sp. TH3]|uniref:hypothetical protein n=1 Tax=Salinimicrobium sp. TH3 TaxID=2997342 RepID=UPI0022743D17|nr:hypothetical protein [Salinimicrobium sp. TH3]MCY2686803.1 hypothetical protein [Salinimicrobium sp. TH3]
MKIRYKKSRSRFYLIMTFVWLILLTINILYVDSSNWPFWIWIILSLGYISHYTFEYFNQYLKIENGFIYKTSFFPRKVELNKVRKFKKFAGDYIIETDKSELRIDTTLIDRDSLKELDKALASFDSIRK